MKVDSFYRVGWKGQNLFDLFKRGEGNEKNIILSGEKKKRISNLLKITAWIKSLVL